MYSLIVDKPLVCQREITRSLVFALCRRRRLSVPALRTALAFGGAVFRRCGRLLGVSSRLQPLRGLCLRTACARASSRFAASNGQRSGRECIFTHSSQSSIHIARKACLWLLLLTGLTSACFRHRRRPPCAPQKMPEMTYTPSFLIAAPFFPYFVNALPHAKPLHAVFYAHPFLEKCGTNRSLLPSNS